MNERIQELIKQATECYSNGQERTFDKEKFAELIVKECAEVCNQRARSAPMGSDEQCEAEDCAHAMIKRFGVDK